MIMWRCCQFKTIISRYPSCSLSWLDELSDLVIHLALGTTPDNFTQSMLMFATVFIIGYCLHSSVQ